MSQNSSSIKTVIIVTSLLLVGVIAYAALSKPDGSTAQLASKAKNKLTSVVGGQDPIESSGYLSDLSANVDSVTIIYPQLIRPVAEDLFAFREKIVASKVWNQVEKSGADKQLTDAIEDSLGEVGIEETEAEEPKFADIKKFFDEDLSEFKEVLIGTAPTENTFPGVFVLNSFASDKYPNLFKEKLAGVVPLTDEGEDYQAKIFQDAEDPNTFKIELTVGEKKQRLSGSVVFSSNEVVAKFPENLKYTAGEGEKLVDRAEFKELQPAIIKNSFVTSWSDNDSLQNSITNAIKAFEIEDEETIDAILAEVFIQGYKTSLYSYNVDAGSLAKYCNKLSLNVPSSKARVEAFNKPSQQTTSLANLINQETFLALGLAIKEIASATRTAVAYMGGENILSELKKEADYKWLIEYFESLGQILTDYQVGEVSFGMSVPAGMPAVNFSLLITHKTNETLEFLKALSASTTKLTKMEGSSLTSVLSEDNQLTISDPTIPGLSLIGKVHSKGKLLFSSSQFSWPAVAERITADTRYFKKGDKIANRSIEELNQQHDYAVYFSTQPLITLGQGFAGMLLGMAQAQAQDLSPDDIREFLQLFSFDYYVVGKINKQGSDIICHEEVGGIVEN